MRRRDVVWWSVFGATTAAVLALGVWVHLGGEPHGMLFAFLPLSGIVLATTLRVFGIRGLRTIRPGARSR
ncbi:hypothetical protein GA0074695_4003 [Micromonospora viridifaciens]|uniref:Uncharacterized protein n=1 Tax=Micromonospora viridifaciens TaxID=1881 RepID=A0A1C4Y9Y8_MICVI|nr:hypothetical protein [Micromonospora viridifaciens]SCF17552.1 hypothetical protein GA0074695_4003 [Micromonospora viridifaciens]